MVTSSHVRIALRHQAGFDNPYWVRYNGAARTSDDGRPEAHDMWVFCSQMGKVSQL